MAKLSLKQETVEAFAASATQKAAMIQRRVSQKKNKVLESVPLLNKMKEKISDFDQKMTDKFGKNYTKTRNILMGVGKFYIAGQIGAPAIVALGAVNAVKALKPILKEAEEQRENGQVSGLIDYIKKNPKETIKSVAMASLGAAVIGCGLTGAAEGKFIARAGVAALVVAPEMKSLASTTKQWVQGEATLRDVAREAATVGLSMSAFVAGSSWGHGDMDHGGCPSAGSHDIAVPISKADKIKNPLRPQPAGLQKTLSNQEVHSNIVQTTIQKIAKSKSK